MVVTAVSPRENQTLTISALARFFSVTSFAILVVSISRKRLGIVTKTAKAKLTSGEQAANALQPADSSRHMTTQDAKVVASLEASLLVA